MRLPCRNIGWRRPAFTLSATAFDFLVKNAVLPQKYHNMYGKPAFEGCRGLDRQCDHRSGRSGRALIVRRPSKMRCGEALVANRVVATSNRQKIPTLL
jgi:hypothetical protein